MDPFDVLGISPTKDINKIKQAYKSMLVATHPDKMNGDAKYFMLVHEAYKTLSTAYSVKERNAPTENMSYKEEAKKYQRSNSNSKKFTSEQFNSFFDNNKIESKNPFNKGYASKMSDRLNYQEDANQLSQSKVRIPKRDVVIYKEPKPVSSGWTDNCEPLGVHRISDFTSQRGSDYMRAYSHPEEQVDTARRYKNIEDLKHTRTNENFQLTQAEEAYYRQSKEDKAKLDLYRSRQYQQDSASINERYTSLHERLGWKPDY